MEPTEARPAPKVSIIIPTYNEVENIGRLIRAVLRLHMPHGLEIIVIDDGSTDGTIEAVEELCSRHGCIKLLVRPARMGLGSAYKNGFKLASGDVVVQMDGDLSHRPSDLPKLVHALGGAGLAIGSRYIEGGAAVGWSPTRIAMSGVANLLAKLLLRLGVKDATSGFRAWDRRSLEACLPLSVCSGYDFQIEMALIAEKLGLKVAEVPITFVERGGGRSKLGLKDILVFTVSLLRLLKRSKAIGAVGR